MYVSKVYRLIKSRMFFAAYFANYTNCFFLFAFLFNYCLFATSNSATELVFVHVVWRHGDRSPSDPTFPTDTKNPEWSWPQGWGELTEVEQKRPVFYMFGNMYKLKIGMKQHHDLGAYFRKRYVDSGFLSKDYNATQVYIRSSDYNRTIMSALSNLAGMYPPTGDKKWMKDINWEPIPVHSVPKDYDPVLWMDRPCPKAHDIYFNEILKSDAARQVEADYSQLLTFLRNKTGHPISTLDDVRFIFDPLNCERIYNNSHSWPDWMTPALFTQIEELHRISKTFCYHDPRMQRFRGGLLFWDIASRSEQKSKNDPTLFPATLKYYAHSAHDGTLIALFENLGAYDGKVPPYASAVMFELHRTENKKYIIQSWYINETGSQTPVPIAIKGCDGSGVCTLEKFVDLARRQAPKDWYTECGFSTKEQEHHHRVAVAAEILGATTALLFILLIISITQLLKNRSGYSSSG